HPGAHHVPGVRAELAQRLQRDPERAHRLRVRVPDMGHLTVHSGRTAGAEQERPGLHGPAVPERLLPRPAGAEPDDRGHDRPPSAASACGIVNARAYSALPTITPSTPAGSSAASWRRSSSLDTPPLAITGRLVRSH